MGQQRVKVRGVGTGEGRLRVEEMHGLLMTWVHEYMGSGNQVLTRDMASKSKP